MQASAAVPVVHFLPITFWSETLHDFGKYMYIQVIHGREFDVHRCRPTADGQKSLITTVTLPVVPVISQSEGISQPGSALLRDIVSAFSGDID
jgi:hypothetical protein